MAKMERKIKEALKHLKEDSKTWLGLSKKAKKEYRSDRRLMKKLRKVA
jgi:hypothetical protein